MNNQDKIDNLTQLIENRRSVKPVYFNDEKIADEDLIKLLELANWAPSHGHTEPWKFIIMKGEAIRRFSIWASELYKSKNTEETFLETKYNKILTGPGKCSHFIGIVMDRTNGKPMPECEDLEALGGAIQNFHLGVTAKGYAGFWSSGFPTYEKESREYFNLSEGETLQGFFYLGVPQEVEIKSSRRPLENKLVWLDE